MMINIKNIQFIFSIIFLSLFINNVRAQISGIPPSLINQVQGMSSSEHQRLAKQYGINIESAGLSNSVIDTDIGSKGMPLNTNVNDNLNQVIDESKKNEIKIREFKRNEVPIFERTFDDANELPIYGKFLFDSEVSTYAPVDNAPVPDDYRLGVGDTLNILMYGNENNRFNLAIDRNGNVNFPKLGSFSLAGMTFDGARDYIESRVKNQMIGVQVSVSIGRLRSINVFMTGEASMPGAFSVSALSSVSQLLFVAGGVSDIGSLRNIHIKKNGKISSSFDLYRLLTEGDDTQDIRLQSGDVVFIPPINNTVIIDGAIRRPGRYEIIEGETIGDIIKLAGGVTNRAFIKQISIERYDFKNDLPVIINLDLRKALNIESEIFDGDIVRIASVNNQSRNSIMLHGAVHRPGQYGWYEGIRFTDIAKNLDIDFTNNVDLGLALIMRRQDANSYKIDPILFDINKAIINPGSEQDLMLNPHDEILVFAVGNNDDLLNDYEEYYRDEVVPQIIPIESDDYVAQIEDENDQNLSDGLNLLNDNDTEEIIEEREKENEFLKRNDGKRRLMLKPFIEKLYQQANSKEAVKVVSISGAVKVPGEYPLAENSTFQDLVQIAGGYSDDAYVNKAELRNIIINNNGSVTTNLSEINLEDMIEVPVKSRDHLRIKRIKDWNISDSIILKGEIFYPGEYLISPNETLSSVIARAGGFTNESFINGAIFTRESIKEKERSQLKILSDTIRRDAAARSMTKESQDFSVSSAEVEAGIEALMSSEVYGRLIIDIPRLINGDMSADIVLQSGDILDIPKYTNAVTVVGEVRRAGSFVLQNSYDIHDYIELAAGMTARGNKKELYIIRADGSVDKAKEVSSLLTFNRDGDYIKAGDTIVVPIKSSYQTPLNLYSTVSQVVFQSIASIAAFSTVFN